jgi:hypothetical protein
VPITQNNQGAPNINVPGSGNTFNINPVPGASVGSDEIIQAGIIVGKAYGGRRLPSDATMFEFKEITN